jgi:cellulose synthase/poly-beta-1,6-N-acetylglucosamine synthase-like glycosyltransferase
MSIATFFLLLGVVSLLIAMHPFTTYPWSLLVLQAVRPYHRARLNAVPETPLRCAICVCAYNEERMIGKKIENLLALKQGYPDLEVLVYVDASTDATAEILMNHANEFRVHVASHRHGKTHGMNLLARQATAPILVFTDANVMLDLDCLDDFRRYFRDPDIGCVCGNLIYTNDADSATAASGSVYWRFEEAIKKLEMETGSMMGADGSLFAIRRDLHQPPPDHLIDDMYVSLTIMCSGYRVVQASDARAYEESVTSRSEEFKRKTRIACQAFNVHRLLWPKLKQLNAVQLYEYVSHKVIRWFTIYLLALSALSFEIALIAAGYVGAAIALPLAAALLFILGHFVWHKQFAPIEDIFAAFAGTGLGVWQSLRGERYQTWTPAASIRKAG